METQSDGTAVPCSFRWSVIRRMGVGLGISYAIGNHLSPYFRRDFQNLLLFPFLPASLKPLNKSFKNRILGKGLKCELCNPAVIYTWPFSEESFLPTRVNSMPRSKLESVSQFFLSLWGWDLPKFRENDVAYEMHVCNWKAKTQLY